jgi:uncharacterized protein (TIGR03083 family)
MTSATPDRAGAMRQLWDDVVGLTDDLSPGDWDRRVDWCPDWTVADLISHLGGLQSAYNGDPQPAPPDGWVAPEGGNAFDAAMAPAIAARRSWTSQQRTDELHRASNDHVAALRNVQDWDAATQGPLGETTQADLFRVRAFDVWVHLQDLREALGLPVNTADESPAAQAAYDHVLHLLPWMFVKRVGAGDGDALNVELTAPANTLRTIRVVGRRAGWENLDDAVADRVTAAPAALTLLASGRGSAQRWRDEGALDWSGRWGEAFVERAGMF